MSAFKQACETSSFSASCFLGVMAVMGRPESLLDAGCGPGHIVLLARMLGIDALGLDHEAKSSLSIRKIDLREPWELDRTFDWVFSWEVAEHLEEEFALGFCAELVQATKPGGILFFTAAIPGQGGHRHLNEQPHSYWRDRLKALGMEYDETASLQLRAVWRVVSGTAWWYPQNIQVFRRPL